jgi:hypothetical protein
MWHRGDDLLIESLVLQQLPPKFDAPVLGIGFIKNFLQPENLLLKCSISC